MVNGLLLINKEKDWTSRDVINKLSHIFKHKKFGHSGTLDPFAEGLLLVASGKALKLLPYLEALSKTYVATLKLGTKTDTGDLTGEVIEVKETKEISKTDLEKILASFLGESYQIPPMYSALKKDGVPLYKLARKGIEIKREPRKIYISDIKLISFINNEITFEVSVSKGTYIRVLGEDIASKLDTVGHLTSLKRIKVGEYDLKSSKKVNGVKEEDFIEFNKIKLSINKLEITDEELIKKISYGQKINLDIKDDIILLASKDNYLAIYERENANVFKCKRGLL